MPMSMKLEVVRVRVRVSVRDNNLEGLCII